MRSKISLTNELRMAIALLEIPVSGWTCLRTVKCCVRRMLRNYEVKKLAFVDVRRVSLLAGLAALLLLAVSGRGLGGLFGSLGTLGGFGGGLGGGGGGGFAGSGSGFGSH
jgi:hypothetical protein